jgi:hypothetical protein
MSLILGWYSVFDTINLGLWGLGRKITETESFLHHLGYAYPQCDLPNCGHLAELLFLSFINCKSFPALHTVLTGRKSLSAAHSDAPPT